MRDRDDAEISRTKKSSSINYFFDKTGEINHLPALRDLSHENEGLKQQIDFMKTFAGSIVHEMETPIAILSLHVGLLEQYLPLLVGDYILLQQTGMVDNLSQRQLTLVEKAPAVMKNALNAMSTLARTQLMNLREGKINTEDFSRHSIKSDINAVLAVYPFFADEGALIEWEDDIDFTYNGNSLYTQQIFINLLKNALYYIKTSHKGKITICQQQGEEFNKVIFKDTASGINNEFIPHLFKRFNCDRLDGTGLGLAFCKTVMRAYGGDIICESIAGDYTTFTLLFPTRQVGAVV